jgi:para-aminobenzoate synthetase component 1
MRNTKRIRMAEVQNSKRDCFARLAMTDKATMTQALGETDKQISCRLHYREIRVLIDLAALSEIVVGLESASILGGNIARADAGGFSYWAAEPREIFEFRSGQKEPFAELELILGKYRLREADGVDSRPFGFAPGGLRSGQALRGNDRSGNILPKGMFCGGWIGYFGYELGRYIEKLPETAIDDVGMPLIRLCFYDRVIAYDHNEGAFWLIALELPSDCAGPDEKLAGLEQLLDKAAKTIVTRPAPADLDEIDLSQFRCNMDEDYYLRMLGKIRRYIYDGDVYQINFSQRFECDYGAEAIDLFHWQNLYNPSGYAAYIDGGDFHIVSASPEMFITISDGFIRTKPIKGTRRRICLTPDNKVQAKQINEKNYYELLYSDKEQAELNMIVDLERNDLARICVPGTRRVIQPRTIETYPTVFHAVATVAGQLRSGVGLCDILRAMFPGGSITGAPKIRSMEIIDQTEPTARGVYTGSIGYIGLDGNVCLNIAIRTIIIAGAKAFAQTGGGIVADSDPEAEWTETITKARALLAGINSVQRNSSCVVRRA